MLVHHRSLAQKLVPKDVRFFASVGIKEIFVFSGTWEGAAFGVYGFLSKRKMMNIEGYLDGLMECGATVKCE